MSSSRRSKLDKKKRREKRIRRQRNLRRNQPAIREDDELDLESALDALPAEMHIERIQRRIAHATGRRSFSNGVEVLRELERIRSPGNESLAAALETEIPEESAQDLVFLAFDPANADHALELVHAALELDPDCVDALAISAIQDDCSADERIARLEHAVATGERLLGGAPFFAENRGRFWEDVFTRPYMRARRILGNVRMAREELDSATREFDALLELDPLDRVEARDALLGIALQRADVGRARELLDASKTDDSVVEPWGRVLERWLAGDRRGAARALRVARATNPWAETVLLDPDEFDELCIDGAIDDDEERDAERVSMRLGRAWESQPEALRWLEDGGLASTEEERLAAVSSFAPPLSRLFELGAVEHRDEWLAYRTSCDLTEAHVPELIRMATTPDLHELEEPEAWAPLHAWRALAELGAESAVVPLLRLSLEQPEDDWLLGDLPRVFASIGPKTLTTIVAWMKQPHDDDEARITAYEAIAALVAQHPSLRERALTALADEIDVAHEHEDRVNGSLVSALVELRAAELAPRIQSLFEDELVDPAVAGDWREVRRKLQRPRPR